MFPKNIKMDFDSESIYTKIKNFYAQLYYSKYICTRDLKKKISPHDCNDLILEYSDPPIREYAYEISTPTRAIPQPMNETNICFCVVHKRKYCNGWYGVVVAITCTGKFC